MQAISSDSQNILTLAWIGIFLSGTWLAYNLGLFTFFSAINDEKKIVLPSFLFLLSPFLFPFIFSHPLPGALPSIMPVITFIVGQLLAESNNKKILSEKERELINQIYIKLSKNYKTVKDSQPNFSYLVIGHPLGRLKDLSVLEDIKVDSIKLRSLQGLIQANLRLASDELITYTEECARVIDKLNTGFTQAKGTQIDTITTQVDISRNLLKDIKDFLVCYKQFFDTVQKIKNFRV